MPTYEYACKKCGEHLEVVQSFKDKPLTTCPACGGELRKVFGNIGIVFKGSGFYKTDSRSAASTNGASKHDGTKRDGVKQSSDGSAGAAGSEAGGGTKTTEATKSSGSETKGKAASSPAPASSTA
ncbi:MAG: FmdB family transcriptional regulator [Actinobacteria bacterium]|nr:FmdB family transcriptional regulator [Actinomycetota bacterium]